MDDNKSWPIAPISIPPDHCYDAMNLSVRVDGTLVTLSWDSPHDNDGFYLIYKKASAAQVQQTIFGNGTSLQLEANTQYTWSVRTMCDRLGNRGANTVVGAPFSTGEYNGACPKIDTSGALVITAASTTRIEWTPVPNNTDGYDVEVNFLNTRTTNSTFRADISSVRLTTLNPNTEYSWRVRCRVIGSPWSELKYFRTGVGSGCLKVDITAVLDVTTGILYWKLQEAAASYRVYINGTLVSGDHPLNIMTLQNLLPLTEYNIIIIPNCENGPGEASFLTASTGMYRIANPDSLAVSGDGQGSATVVWQPVAQLTSQEVMINGTKTVVDADASSFSFSVNPQAKYAILIRSVKDDEKSTGSFISYLAESFCRRVEQVYTLSKNSQSIAIAWPAVAGATAYRVRYAKAGTSGWISSVINQTTLIISGLLPVQQYQIEVITICGVNEGEPAQYNEITTPVPICPMVIKVKADYLAATAASFSFEVDAHSQDGIFEATATPVGGGGNVINKSNGSPISLEDLTPNKQYNVVISNLCSSNPSYSNALTITTPKLCIAPTGLTAAMTTGNTILSVSWTAVAGVTGYAVRYRPVHGEWIVLPNQVGVSFTAAAVSGIYEVQVSSLFEDGRSCSTTITSTIPKVLGVSNTGTGSRSSLAWSPIAGADQYKIIITSLGDDERMQLSEISAVSIFLLPETMYSATVRAIYNNVAGAASDALVFTTDNTAYPEMEDCVPPAIAAVKQDSHINDSTVTVSTKDDIVVIIKDYNDSFRYVVQLFVAGEPVALHEEQITPYVEDATGVVSFIKVPAADYNIVVTRMKDGQSCKAESPVLLTVCDMPTGFADDVTGDTSVSFTWDEGATSGYEIYMNGSLAGTFGSGSGTISGLEPLTEYTFNLRAICSGTSRSAFTADLAVTTTASA